ncbi:hypothetical protein SKAU_G00044150 [Synaphobranchus kaupii]|uniref:Uncharacterized protein n=1 Tax=Synaphobranchus kaupii TaxID=118154 RepID=A0A9Q1G309_SYNKA|nr:hypothetical protein SKAU_G00044150 [Synaphobranchus kaupii]
MTSLQRTRRAKDRPIPRQDVRARSQETKQSQGPDHTPALVITGGSYQDEGRRGLVFPLRGRRALIAVTSDPRPQSSYGRRGR